MAPASSEKAAWFCKLADVTEGGLGPVPQSGALSLESLSEWRHNFFHPVPLPCLPSQGPQKHLSIPNPKSFLKLKAPTPPKCCGNPKLPPNQKAAPPPITLSWPHSHSTFHSSMSPYSSFSSESHSQDYNAYPYKRVSRWKETAPDMPLSLILLEGASS